MRRGSQGGVELRMSASVERRSFFVLPGDNDKQSKTLLTSQCLAAFLLLFVLLFLMLLGEARAVASDETMTAVGTPHWYVPAHTAPIPPRSHHAACLAGIRTCIMKTKCSKLVHLVVSPPALACRPHK